MSADLPESSNSNPPQPSAHHEWIAYLLAIATGFGGGVLEVWLGDLSSTALIVAATAMALGCAWPRRPWRWGIAVGLGVPLAVLVEWNQHPGRGMLYGSFAMLAPALVAAFGGSFLRMLVRELFRD